MGLGFQTGLLLLIPAVVAMLTRRLRLPYSVGLVAAGIFLAMMPFAPKVSLTKDVIFTGLLPPLLFEAALYIHWNQLRRDFSVIVVLATLGVLLSASLSPPACTIWRTGSGSAHWYSAFSSPRPTGFGHCNVQRSKGRWSFAGADRGREPP